MPAHERILRPATGHPVGPEIEPTGQKLVISVVFTSVGATVQALKEAGALATSLGARINLLVPQLVPHPAPLESPPILIDWNERRFHVIAGQSPVETTVRIYLCRDRFETLASVLDAGSLVVLGGRKRWWRTPEARLARQLRKAGHQVILTETE